MTKRNIFVLAVIFIFAVVNAADDSCPPPKDLAPCTCDGEGANCMGQVTDDQICRGFSQSKFKYGGVRSIWIQGTPITQVRKCLIGQLKVQEAYIEINNITTVDLSFLDGSAKTLALLSFYGNKIREFDFTYLEKFKVLYLLNLAQNQIESIPAKGFESYTLVTLILAQNKISSVGPEAFSRLHNLQALEMSQNQLKVLGPLSFSNKNQNLGISLVYNQIHEVSPTAFNGSSPAALRLAVNKLTTLKYDAFGPLITSMGQHGGSVEVSSNPFSCRGCDDYKWLVQNKQALSYVILGFMCTDGTTLQGLTYEKIGC